MNPSWSSSRYLKAWRSRSPCKPFINWVNSLSATGVVWMGVYKGVEKTRTSKNMGSVLLAKVELDPVAVKVKGYRVGSDVGCQDSAELLVVDVSRAVSASEFQWEKPKWAHWRTLTCRSTGTRSSSRHRASSTQSRRQQSLPMRPALAQRCRPPEREYRISRDQALLTRLWELLRSQSSPDPSI